MSRWTSADENAQRASESPPATPAQSAFDGHAYEVTKLVRRMREITQVGMCWPRYSHTGDRIQMMRDLLSDLDRELSVLSIEGRRP